MARLVHLQDAGAVRVIEAVKTPLDLQGVQIDAEEVPAVVRNEEVPAPDDGAVLHAVEHFFGGFGGEGELRLLRVNGEGPGGLVIPRIQFHDIQYAVFAGINELVRLGVHKSRAVKGRPVGPRREGIVVSEGIQNLAVQETDHLHPRSLTVVVEQAAADIKDGIPARIQRTGALEGKAQKQPVTSLLAGLKVDKIHMPVQGAIDDLDESVLLLRPVVHVHDLFRALRPLDHKGLAGPAAAAPPAAAGGAEAIGADAPAVTKAPLGDLRAAVLGVVAEVVAAEGDDTLDIRVVVGAAEVDGVGLIRLIAVHQLAVHRNAGAGDDVRHGADGLEFRKRRRHGRGRGRRGRCGRRRGTRRWQGRRRRRGIGRVFRHGGEGGPLLRQHGGVAVQKRPEPYKQRRKHRELQKPDKDFLF